MDNVDLSCLVYEKTSTTTVKEAYSRCIPEIPDGYVFVSFGPVKKGSVYINIFGELHTSDMAYEGPRIIVRPLEINDVYTEGVRTPVGYTVDGFRKVQEGDWFLESGGEAALHAYSYNLGSYRIILIKDTYVPRKFTVETTGRHRAINKGEYYYFNGEVKMATGCELGGVFAEPCTVTFVIPQAANQYSLQDWQLHQQDCQNMYYRGM